MHIICCLFCSFIHLFIWYLAVFFVFGLSTCVNIIYHKKVPKGKRPGLRSQEKDTVKEDVAWDTLGTSSEEEASVGLSSAQGEPGPTRSSEGMVSNMRDFLSAQQLREDKYL